MKKPCIKYSALILLLFIFVSCKNPDIDNTDKEDSDLASESGSASLVYTLLNEMDSNLISAGYSENHASIVRSGAIKELRDSNLSSSDNIDLVSPAIVRGAISSINDLDSLSTDDEKISAIEVICSSATLSLNGRVEDNSENNTNPRSRKTVETPQTSVVQYADVLENISSAAIRELSESGVSQEALTQAINRIVSSIVAQLLNAGILESEVGSAGESIIKGVTSVLDNSGIEASVYQTALEHAISGLFSGLGRTGISSTGIGDASDEVATGIVQGLIIAGKDSIVISGFLDGIRSAIISGLGDCGLTSEEINSVQSNITTAFDTSTAVILPPEILSVSPVNNVRGVGLNTSISISFAHPVQPSTVTVNTSDTECRYAIQLSEDDFTTCIMMSGSPDVSNDNKTFVMSPCANLSYNALYKLRISTAIKNGRGLPLAANQELSFYTGSVTDNSLGHPVEISSGERHNCVRFSEGAIKCWGYNNNGQLGQGNTSNFGSNDSDLAMGINLSPIDLGTHKQALTHIAGQLHSCAVLGGRSLKCWGDGANWALGNESTFDLGNETDEMGDQLPSIALGKTVDKVAAGDGYTCVLFEDGSLKCWGYNNNGQLGQNVSTTAITQSSSSEINFGSGTTVTAISVGVEHTCAILSDTSLKCWGENWAGQLGLNNTSDRGNGVAHTIQSMPAVNLGAGKTAEQVALGEYHTCALLNGDSGEIICWGYNQYGQLGQNDTAYRGNGSGQDVADISPVNLGQPATQVAAGWNHSCAVLADGSMKCWGHNQYGQLGQGTQTHIGDGSGEMGTLATVDFGGDTTVLSISAGKYHTCALLSDYSVKCWGINSLGELGQETGTTPLIDVSSLSPIKF
ncbi:Ig-like domain-containing protein [bacterium]|nr:Ig-like domain-containing protein [bacterium]